MSIFKNGYLIKDNEKELDKQLHDYCKSIGINKEKICQPIIKNCIQNISDSKLFDENKFKFNNNTEIENEKKCKLSWGSNYYEQKKNILDSYNLKFLAKSNSINIKNLYDESFIPEDWLNKLVPNNIKNSILNKLAPNTEYIKRVRSNRINNFNNQNLLIFSENLINDIKNCNSNIDIGKFYLTIDYNNQYVLVDFFKNNKKNINYINLIKNILNFIEIDNININKLTIDDICILMYSKMNEQIPYLELENELNNKKKNLICFIIKKFIELHINIEDIKLLENIEEWCLHIHKKKNYIFNNINNNKIYNIIDYDIYLAFDINISNKLNIYLSYYNNLFKNIINEDIFEKIKNNLTLYSKNYNNNIYAKLLCKIFKLTNDDFIYNIFFYIVKKIIFEYNNNDYNNFIYYIFLNYFNIYENLDVSQKLIKNSIILIAQNAMYESYDDIINLNKESIKNYYDVQKPLKLITKEMVERLKKSIIEINNDIKYRINNIKPIENTIQIIIKNILLVDINNLASEIDIYQNLNIIQVQLPKEIAAIYDIRFILKNLKLFKDDLLKQKVNQYSFIYPIERVYNYYCDNIEKNNLHNINKYFEKSMKMINGKPIITTTYDDLLYLFNFFNEYNRRKLGKSNLLDDQSIANLQFKFNKIKDVNNKHFYNEFIEINKLFYNYLINITKNKNFINFINQIKNVAINS